MMSSRTRCSRGSSSRHHFRYHIAICRAGELRNTIGGAHFSTFVSSSLVGHQTIQHTHTHTYIHSLTPKTLIARKFRRQCDTRRRCWRWHRIPDFLLLFGGGQSKAFSVVDRFSFHFYFMCSHIEWNDSGKEGKKLLARERNFSNKHKVIKCEAKKK